MELYIFRTIKIFPWTREYLVQIEQVHLTLKVTKINTFQCSNVEDSKPLWNKKMETTKILWTKLL